MQNTKSKLTLIAITVLLAIGVGFFLSPDKINYFALPFLLGLTHSMILGTEPTLIIDRVLYWMGILLPVLLLTYFLPMFKVASVAYLLGMFAQKLIFRMLLKQTNAH